MFQDLIDKKKAISVIGLGYVGLPIALEFAKHFKVIGFDINAERVALMQQGIDPSKELTTTAFHNVDISFTSNLNDLKDAHFHIIAVPTDIDEHKVPNLKPLLGASSTIGQIIKKGDYVIYESTVYPGCTEEDCIPIIEQESGLKAYTDFKFGYSPERIVPGDKVKTLATILKIVSGCDAAALEEIDKVYATIITAGTYKASSVKVAEAAKVIENTQRDINISLVNELAIIFDKMDIDTNEVIKAASTKWNFHPYQPGLVGGHCISVDPFYLMHKARELGVEPQVIAAGRRVNDFIPSFIAKKVVTTLIDEGKNPGECKVLVLGITFKEDVADIRNSKVVDLINELKEYSITIDVVDPHASYADVMHEYKIEIKDAIEGTFDAIVLAVGHQQFKNLSNADLIAYSKDNLLLFDIKGIKNKAGIYKYWKL
jgi:UDP-N-acetyl-D-glucosamine/UDP-N-acetyl-D-galactosamine dehydrogenase